MRSLGRPPSLPARALLAPVSRRMAWRSHGRDNASLVAALLRNGVLKTQRVADAMRSVDRGLFVPPELQGQAYDDAPAPIGYAQTISAPHMCARVAPHAWRRTLSHALAAAAAGSRGGGSVASIPRLTRRAPFPRRSSGTPTAWKSCCLGCRPAPARWTWAAAAVTWVRERRALKRNGVLAPSARPPPPPPPPPCSGRPLAPGGAQRQRGGRRARTAAGQPFDRCVQAPPTLIDARHSIAPSPPTHTPFNAPPLIDARHSIVHPAPPPQRRSRRCPA